MASQNNIPLPTALKIKSSEIATSWKRFKSQWSNYELATDLAAESKEKRTAVLLTCIGNEAYDVFQTLVFADDAHRKDIDHVIRAFDDHWIGETNVTYERYLLNKRVQEPSESFDSFLSELRRLVKSCEYGELEDSILKDRIVIGITEDATRRKLLQLRRLDLKMAIDVCRANETASRHLRVMSNTEDVQALRRGQPHERNRARDKSRDRKSFHEKSKDRQTFAQN